MKVGTKNDSEIRQRLFKLSEGKHGSAPAGFDRANKAMPAALDPAKAAAAPGKIADPATKVDIKSKKPAAPDKNLMLKSDVSANDPKDP